jgi:hypothetical protein
MLYCINFIAICGHLMIYFLWYEASTYSKGVCGRVVGWGNMLHAGSSQVLFPMKSLNSSKLPNPSGPPLWSGDQSSWLQIQMSGFDSRRYQIFWEVVGLERYPLSLVSTFEELLDRKSSRCGLEHRDYVRRDPPRWPRGTLYPQKLALTSQINGGRSIGIVRSRNKATEFIIYFYYFLVCLLPNPSSRTMALGSTQPLSEMSTRNLLGGKGRPMRKGHNLAAIC